MWWNLIVDIRGTLMLCMRFKCDGGAFMGSKKNNGRVSKWFKIHENDNDKIHDNQFKSIDLHKRKKPYILTLEGALTNCEIIIIQHIINFIQHTTCCLQH
jgi:hypothetical protein